MKTVVIVEHAGQGCLIPPELRDKSHLRLATTPEAMSALERAGLSFQIPEDFVAPKQVENLCAPAYEQLRQVCTELDAVASPEGVFRLAHWELGARVDGILWRSCVLESLSQSRPDAVFVNLFGEPSPVRPRLFELPRACTRWSEVMRLMLPDHRRMHIGRTIVGLRAAAKNRLGRWMRCHPQVWSLVQARRHRLGLGAFLKATASSGPAWLMFKAPYDWQPVLQHECVRGRRIIFDEADRYFDLPADGQSCPVAVANRIKAIWFTFVEQQPKYARASLLALLPDLIELARVNESVMDRLRRQAANFAGNYCVDAVLNAIGSSLREQAVLSAYRSIGVPVSKWQHGSVWWHHRITQRMDDSDLGTADLHLVYGPATQSAYLAASRHPHCRVEVAGFTRLAGIQRNSAEMRRSVVVPKRILYSATVIHGNGWYCGFSPPLLDGIYSRDQAEIVRGLAQLVATHLGVTLTVKLPANAAGQAWPLWIEEVAKQPGCQVIVNESTHAALLREHDTIVIDCATTTLLETLCTDRFVYVLLAAPGWPEDDVRRLARRAVPAFTAGELLGLIEAHSRSGSYAADTGNMDFLSRHAVPALSPDRVVPLVDGMTAARPSAKFRLH